MSLEDALALVVLYAEANDDKFEKAAVRWLGRLLLERPMPRSLAAQSVGAHRPTTWPRIRLGRQGPRGACEGVGDSSVWSLFA